jgi:hypothetical protein
MPMLEDVKKIAEKVTGWSRPKRSALSGLIRARKAITFRFKDDGIIPNHPQWPLSSIAALQSTAYSAVGLRLVLLTLSGCDLYCSHFHRQLVYQKRFNQDGTLGNETRDKACAAYKGSE